MVCLNFVTPPWAHQVEACRRAALLREYALFFEMGTGKTKTVIDILRGQFNANKRVLRTLVFTPPIVVSNWKDEWAKHSKIDPGQVCLLKGTGKQREKLFDTSKAPIFVTNYETLLMPSMFERFKLWKPEAVVCDESHRLKATNSKRSKLMAKLTAANPRPLTYLLSGSPILNSPMDIFQQFLIMDGGATFGSNFFIFRARFFRDRNAGMPKHNYFPDWYCPPESMVLIKSLIATKSMRVEKKDCLDLPPLVKKQMLLPMGKKQAELYGTMKKDLLAMFDKDKYALASLAITKALRLQQIASGYLKVDDGEEIAFDECPKLDALKELLQDLTPGHKVIIWAAWRQNYAQIRKLCESLGVPYVEVHGEVSEAQKTKNVTAFNTDPSVRVLIGHPGSGGIGINLVVASYMIFYSRTFSLDHDQQAEARNYRAGSEMHDKITRIDLISENTIDELVTKKLALKQEIGENLLTDLSVELRKQEV